jgi:hypothetical protein
MEDGGVRAAVEALIGLDVSVADHGELATASAAVARVQAFVDLAKVQIVRRGRHLADAGDTTSAHALIDDGRCTGRDVKATDGRERVCGQLPEFESALAAGEVTGAHLDALAHHTRNLTDEERSEVAAIADELIADATNQHAGLFDRTVKDRVDTIRERHRPDSDVAELERQRRQSSVRRWTDRDTGMRNTSISLDPIRDETLWAVIDAHLAGLRQDPAHQDRPFAELQVEAVMAAIATGPGRRQVPEIVVHTDATTLCHGRHDDTLCETADGVPVPVATMQRWCCEAVLQSVIVRPDGTIDQLCAERRTADRRQRRMLEAMYATCAHPHCSVPFPACRIHHIVWWTRGGATVLANLLPLCERHHHLVHEGRWHLTIDERRRVTWHRPDGTVWTTDTGPNRAPRRSEHGGDHREGAPEPRAPDPRATDPPDGTSDDRCGRSPGAPPGRATPRGTPRTPSAPRDTAHQTTLL